MSSTAEVDLAVLDIAGTTIEEHGAVYVALEESVRAAGADPSPAAIQRWMGADKTEAITALLQGLSTPELVAETFEDFLLRLAKAYAQTPPTPLPGTAEAIAGLRAAGVRVVLTTGFSRDVTASLLATVGWGADVVDGVVCAEEVGAGRPAPYMVFEAMRLTGVHAVSRVLTAGDTVLDLEAGTNAGARFVVGVLSGAMDREQLATSPHTHLLRSVADLPGLVLR